MSSRDEGQAALFSAESLELASGHDPVELTGLAASAASLPVSGDTPATMSSKEYSPILTRTMTLPLVLIALFDVSTVFLQVSLRSSSLKRSRAKHSPVLISPFQSAASLYIPAAVNSAMRAMLLVLTALLSRALRVRDGSAGGFEWAGIGISTLGATVIAANQVIC